MQANVGRETRAEKELRRALYAAGFRYRKNARPVSELRCKADFVFRGVRLCVFVDGCFWHGCTEHFGVPKANAGWWLEKIRANIERDVRQTRALTAHGWHVVRVWEHDLADMAAVVRRIETVVASSKGHRTNSGEAECSGIRVLRPGTGRTPRGASRGALVAARPCGRLARQRG